MKALIAKKYVLSAIVLIVAITYSALSSSVIASPVLKLNTVFISNFVTDSPIKSEVKASLDSQKPIDKFEISPEISDFGTLLAIALSVLYLTLPNIASDSQLFRRKR